MHIKQQQVLLPISKMDHRSRGPVVSAGFDNNVDLPPYMENMSVPCGRMQRRTSVLLIILCMGSLFCFKLYTAPYLFNTTYSAVFRGQYKQNFSSTMEPFTTNVELHNKPGELTETNLDRAMERVRTNVQIGTESEDLMKANISRVMDHILTEVKIQTEPEDLMKAGPFKFLKMYKNPCWLNPGYIKNKKALPVLCLPYFYMVGAPKAGTTDINRRLTKHPQISSRVPKEPHWLTRKRFSIHSRGGLDDYQRTYFTSATQEIVIRRDKEGYHNVVFGDCSASTLWDNEWLNRMASIQNLTEPPYTNADIIHHLNPRTKIIVMIRNPIDRVYSDFLYFTHGSPQAFHDKVVKSIQRENTCFKYYSMLHCMYTDYVGTHLETKVRLRIGMYHIHLEDYFRVFPRDQVMVIKLEDFSKNQKEYMKRLFTFLDLGSLNEEALQKIADPNKKANSRKRKDKIVGDMLPETRKLLENFYRPFNEKLVKLLGESFNYN